MSHDDGGTDGGSAQGTSGGVSRRRLLQTVGAGALVGTVGAVAGAQESGDAGGFVQADGTRLVIDGETAAFHGANNFWITDSYRGERSRIDSLFGMFQEMGIDFVRTFAACSGGDAGCYMPAPYEHAEAGYETLDYVIKAAGDHGIKLNLVLADNWDHNGGIAQYVDWIDSASNHGDFFVDENCKDLYKWHVEQTLTRENTLTGREYREEPAIAFWELCNEPRIEGDAFGDGDNSYERRAGALEEWFDEMSSFVHDLDGNHLVSSGTEGFYTREDRTEWFYNDWTGQDFLRHHAVDGIDVCSFHWYPHHWSIPLEYGRTWIAEHVRDAHEELGKPAYLGEFNVNRQQGLETRNEFLAEWYEAMDAYDTDAASIWQIVVPEMHDHDGFQVYRSESGDVLAEYREAVRAKSEADLITGGDDPVLVPPTGVDAVASGSCIDLRWSHVSGASEYAVYLDGSRVGTTAATGTTLTDVSPETEYEIGVAAVGPNGTETDVATRTVSTVGPETVDLPTWERGTVYQSGDRAVWNGIVWEANWYTDDEEPRFESGYAWSFVRMLGTPGCGDGSGTPTPTPQPETPTATPEPETPTATPDPETPTSTPKPETPTPEPEPPTPSRPPAIGENRPTDLDGDGLFEDLNGNGELDSDDVVTFFDNYDEPAVTDHADAYDFNDSGDVDFDDLVRLFNRL